MLKKYTLELLTLTLLSLALPSYAINLMPTAEGTLLFPVPSVVAPFAFGMNNGQIGGGLGGSYCLSDDIHCKANYDGMLAYGFGDPTHIVNIDIAGILSSAPETPESDSLTTRGSAFMKIRHFFPGSKTAIATGINWIFFNKFQDTSPFSNYFTITQLIPSKPDQISGDNFPLSITTGASQGVAYSQITCAEDAAYSVVQHNSRYYPFIGIGIQFTPKIALAVDDYYRGIVNMSITTQFTKKSPQISLGLLNVLAQHPDEQSRAIMLSVSL
ncbi:MAG: hypothetical protein CMF55_02980 [Legionellales bacterium]|mgnify:CR=1 FL=1|nr:hypothetical protein [Legionellales bacterium]HAG62141.1 hypothetical protein [Coxiellaceae bacterium]